MSVFDELVGEASRRAKTLGTAESLTGGLLGYTISTIPGAGDVYLGSIVSYHREVKYGLLAVPDGPVVTPSAAETMAATARALLGCDLAIALTGVAGPQPQDGVPVGTVFVAVATVEGESGHRRFRFQGSPEEVRLAAVEAAARFALGRLQPQGRGRDPTLPR